MTIAIAVVVGITTTDDLPGASAGPGAGGPDVDGRSAALAGAASAPANRARSDGETPASVEVLTEMAETDAQTAVAESAATQAHSLPAGNRSARGMALHIPAIWLRAPIVDLGLTENGSLEVPDDGMVIGWYDITALPGDAGPALLGGHFDWNGSIAVFASLGQLQEGDRIELYREPAADPLVYIVESLVRVDPTLTVDQVVGGEGESALILITCGGRFDEMQGGYEYRLVVRAVFGDDRPLGAPNR